MRKFTLGTYQVADDPNAEAVVSAIVTKHTNSTWLLGHIVMYPRTSREYIHAALWTEGGAFQSSWSSRGLPIIGSSKFDLKPRVHPGKAQFNRLIIANQKVVVAAVKALPTIDIYALAGIVKALGLTPFSSENARDLRAYINEENPSV